MLIAVVTLVVNKGPFKDDVVINVKLVNKGYVESMKDFRNQKSVTKFAENLNSRVNANSKLIKLENYLKNVSHGC